MLTFDFEKSNFDRLYIQMWFEFFRNEYGFMLGRLKLVKTNKIVKSQNVDFGLEKVKLWIWFKCVELPYCPTKLNNNIYWDLTSLSLACDMQVAYCMQDTYPTKNVMWWDKEALACSLLVNKFYSKVKWLLDLKLKINFVIENYKIKPITLFMWES